MNEQIAIIGLGLIGGSLAKALKIQNPDIIIIGVDASPEARAVLSEASAVDRTYAEMTSEVMAQASVIIIATPPHSWGGIVKTLGGYGLANVRLIMDTGSVKHYANDCFSALPHFVAAHPIAGSEFSGAAFSTAGLFAGKRVILTPHEDTPETDILAAETFWELLGTHPKRLGAALHDRIYAYVSHLPQFLAYALGKATLSPEQATESYLKFLRLNGSLPGLWVSIFQHNPFIIEAAEHLLHVLGHIMGELRAGELQPQHPIHRERAEQLLPRIIASSLISVVTMEEKRSDMRLSAYAGSGFADMTHPALTPPEEDLALISAHTNDVIALLEATETTLRTFLLVLKQGEWDILENFFDEARNAYGMQLESMEA